MKKLKKITLTIPDNLLREVDDIVTEGGISRSELVQEAMQLYILKRKRIDDQAKLKQAYLEMAEINLEIAEGMMNMDNAQLQNYEESLKELETTWSLKEEIYSTPT